MSKPSSAARPSWAPPPLDEGRLTESLRQLEWTVRIRLDGLLQGNHLGIIPGPGTEPGEARAYEPGDDVRRMDWAVTARTGEPHIRQSVADRELETWVALGTKRKAVAVFGVSGNMNCLIFFTIHIGS